VNFWISKNYNNEQSFAQNSPVRAIELKTIIRRHPDPLEPTSAASRVRFVRFFHIKKKEKIDTHKVRTPFAVIALYVTCRKRKSFIQTGTALVGFEFGSAHAFEMLKKEILFVSVFLMIYARKQYTVCLCSTWKIYLTPCYRRNENVPE